MANSDAPFGLRPVRHLNGSPYSGATMRCLVPSSDSTALFIGDPVKAGGSADANGVPTVIRAEATDVIMGVVVSFEADSTDPSLQYRLADTARYVNVCVAPDVIFEVQEDSDGGALTADEVGENADIIYTHSGSTTSGRSGMELDSSDQKTATAQLRILRLVPREDNSIGTNAKWEVLINEHLFKQTAGV